MALVKINESALYAAGFDRAFVEAMRHLVRQVGAELGAITLPEVAGITDTLTPIVNGLTITIAATNEQVDYLRINEQDLPQSDAHLVRRLDDIDVAMAGVGISLADILRRLDDMQCDSERAYQTISDLSRRTAELENRITS